MRGWWRYGNRAVENPAAFTRNPMKRFQTPTSRSPAAVRGLSENRTLQVRKLVGSPDLLYSKTIMNVYTFRAGP